MFNCCAFYSMSGSIPPHIKSISIPLIENETAEFGIAEEITDGIQKKFNDEGFKTCLDNLILEITFNKDVKDRLYILRIKISMFYTESF